MPRSYRYVGPPEILARSRSAPKGVPVRSVADLRAWIKATGQKPTSQIVATFVIDVNGSLRMADRRSEHVACAGGYVPLSAAVVDQIVRAVEPFEYERVYGAFWDTMIERDGKAAVARSAERYRRAIRGDAK